MADSDKANSPLSESPPAGTHAAAEAGPLNVDLQSTILNPQSSISHPLSTIHHPPSPSRLPHVPRLSIGYLLFWTAVTAALLAFSTQLTGQSGELHGRYLVITAVWQMFFGAAVTGFGLILWHARRRTLWPLEPGEWLIVASAVEGLVYMLWSATAPAQVLGGLGTLRIAFIMYVLALGRGATAIGARKTPWWSALLAIGAICHLLAAMSWVLFAVSSNFTFLRWLQFTPMIGSPIVLLLLAIALVVDHRRRAQRHWLHWTGVAIVGGLAMMTLGFSVSQAVAPS